MKRVFLVDETTRVILPKTPWAEMVLAWWADRGISAVVTDQDPETCVRDQAEMCRMGEYLDMTGL